MPIEFSCTSCQKLLRVPDGTEGKPCQCPACGKVLNIPDNRSKLPDAKLPTVPDVSDGKITVTCPNCQYALRCQPELKGTKGQCKQCKHIFVIGEIPSVIEKTALVFSCPKCNQLFDGKAEMAGRKGRCHACGQVFTIELREASVESSARVPAKSSKSPFAPVAKSPQSSPPTSATPKTKPAASKPAAAAKIQLKCGSCGKGLEVPETAAGQKTTCPHCDQLLQIPKVGKNSGSQSGQSIFDQSTDDIFGGLNVGTPQPQSPGTSSGLFDFGGGSSYAAGSQPYMYSEQAAYPPAHQPSAYQPSYQSPYQSPSSMAMSSASTRGDRNWLRSVASWHKQLIWSFVLQLGLVTVFVGVMLILAMLIGQNEPSQGMALAVVGGYILVVVAAIGLGIWFAISYVVLCIKLYDGGKATLFILGYFLGGCIPFLPLILLIVLISNANSRLKQHGIQVGFFGADTSSI